MYIEPKYGEVANFAEIGGKFINFVEIGVCIVGLWGWMLIQYSQAEFHKETYLSIFMAVSRQ